MSWYTDPSLYFDYHRGSVRLWRIRKNFSIPLFLRDFIDEGRISNHLDLVDHSFPWKKSDFDSLLAFLYKYDVSLNCEGRMININRPRDMNAKLHDGNHDTKSLSCTTYFWTECLVDLSLYGLPVRSAPNRVAHYIEGGRPARMEPSPENSELAACIKERDQEKVKNQAFEERVSELAACIKERDQEKVKNQALEIRVSELEKKVSNLKSKSYLTYHKNI